MSISDSSIKGKWDEVAGKAKQAFGDATDDQTVANRGAAQEIKGHGEQAWGSVKETVHDSGTGSSTDATYRNSDTAAADDAHDARTSATDTAENLKHKFQNAVEDLKR